MGQEEAPQPCPELPSGLVCLCFQLFGTEFLCYGWSTQQRECLPGGHFYPLKQKQKQREFSPPLVCSTYHMSDTKFSTLATSDLPRWSSDDACRQHSPQPRSPCLSNLFKTQAVIKAPAIWPRNQTFVPCALKMKGTFPSSFLKFLLST